MRMGRTGLLLASMALGLMLLSGIPGSAPRIAQAIPAKPNFVFIIADDMRKDDLKYMPQTRSLIEAKGMSFTRAYVSNATCCPARATIMRGQYAHNTGVWRAVSGPEGGWEAYWTKGLEKDNVATRLGAAGYRTGLFGKYLNGYEGTYVPPGWDRWFATHDFRYFDYDVSDNGTVRHFGTDDSDYLTDVISERTEAFIGESAQEGEPFFAYVSPIAPHTPATPAPRHEHAYDDAYDSLKAPRDPAFNEKNVSDKPTWIRSRPKLRAESIAQIDAMHENRVESLQAVDDLAKGVVSMLQSAGELESTYIFFTSDNGWHSGEHRIPSGKWRPYEESVHMPLLVRGPGIAADSTTGKLVVNTDYLPTFTDLAGVRRPPYVDGRSLRPVLMRNATRWRTAILLEGPSHISTGKLSVPAYSGIRASSGSKYVEYEGGQKELYSLKSDPYERSSKDRSVSSLALRLKALKICKQAGCRTAENGG
jgi:N-acetylglucosamine-6-sulfatase